MKKKSYFLFIKEPIFKFVKSAFKIILFFKLGLISKVYYDNGNFIQFHIFFLANYYILLYYVFKQKHSLTNMYVLFI